MKPPIYDSNVSSDETEASTPLPKEINNLIAGGLAGMLAKTVVAPIDRIKILYQVTSLPFYMRDFPSVISGIVRTEGVTALWKGNTATMLRVFPYAGMQFMIFNQCKVYFLDKHTEEDKKKDKKWGMKPMESLLSGSLAGAISVLCTYPLDLTRAQLAVLKTNHKSNGVEKTQGFMNVLTGNYSKGGIKGLFRGITPTLLGILPYSGIAFTINEQAKSQIYKFSGRDPTLMDKVQCGALAGLIAQSITYPLEVTRRRMQTIGYVHTSGKDAAVGVIRQLTKTKTAQIEKNIVENTKDPTMLRTMRHVMKEQGLRGFFKGLSMNWLKGPLTLSISFTTFDIIQGWMTCQEY